MAEHQKASHRRALTNAITNQRCPACGHAHLDMINDSVGLCRCGRSTSITARFETKKTASGVRVVARIESAVLRPDASESPPPSVADVQ